MAKFIVILSLLSGFSAYAGLTNHCKNANHVKFAEAFVGLLDEGAADFNSANEGPYKTERVVDEEAGVDKTIERWIIRVSYSTPDAGPLLPMSSVIVSYNVDDTSDCKIDSIGLLYSFD